VSLAPELTVGERYRLVERIAVGGMGEVWRARDELLDRDVAVKILKEEYAADPTFLHRFRNEAKHTAALSHPGIASVFDYGEVGATAFLVMELVPGEPLSATIARDAPLTPERVLDIVGQAGLALAAAHDIGVIHRDVKPGNLLIRPDGVVKVTDFGIARAVDSAPVTQTGMLVGTAAYLSPEQASGRDAGPTSDVYSLGVVTYECLSGTRPFVADSAIGVAMAHATTEPPALPSTVPSVVDDFVMRALSKNPSHRQPSAGDFGRTALALAAQMRTAAEPTVADATTLPTPTAVMPTAEAADASEDRERRRIRNLFVATGAAVVLVGFLLLHSCTNSGVATRTVPNVLGQTYPVAAKSLQDRGFHVVRTTRPSSATPGTVIAQKPTGSVQEGATVTLTVATAPVVTPPTHGPADKGGPKAEHPPKPPHGHGPKPDNQNGD
jgi:serine/threonine protein kinase